MCLSFDTSPSVPVMESNFLHGGKNKYLLQFLLNRRNKKG